MSIVSRVIVPCRIISQINWNILLPIPRGTRVVYPVKTFKSVQIMAQRSITSFFKQTPPKPAAKLEKDHKEIKKKSDNEQDRSPNTNGNEKAYSKRARLDSSESDGSPQKKQTSPAASTSKKSKIKRQRIESSGSESETLPKPKQEIESPKGCENDVKADPDSPSESKENNITEVAVPKTYSSPKNKKKTKQVKSPTTNENKTPAKRKKNASSVGVTSSKDDDSKTKRTPSPVKLKVEKDDNCKKTTAEDKQTVKVEAVNSEKKVLVPEAEYDPSKSKYHPIEDACWAAGAPVPYLALARTLELIEGTSARLKIVDILSNYLRSVIVLTPEDLLPSIYMCLNRLAPAYHSLELGIAETYLMKAVGQCTGRSLAQVREAAARCGDLGRAAELARAAQRTLFAPAPLSARRLFLALRDIARMTGHASVSKKINKIQSLYVACRHSEARFLIRSLEGKLRIGLAEQSVLQALALATATTPPDPDGVKILDASKGLSTEQFKARVDEHALIIKTTYCECPNYESIIPVILQHGVMALPQHCRLTPGVPLKPMLAHPTKGVTEIFDRFEKEQFTCEWKYDGERAQIHVPGDDKPDLTKAAIFSRNQENNTSKYPDVLRRLPELLKESVHSCVLDCEAVAYDTETKQIQPFQILSTRKRKDASEADIKVQVCVFVFDLLYLNGEPLVAQPLLRRRELLREHFREKEGSWQFATARDCGGVDEVQQFLDAAVRGSCEGLMVKALSGANARYDIARRSHNWLKLKKDYLEGVGDTIDAVVLGAYAGRGKRAGTYGGFLLACYEPHSEEYQSLCKIGTGFSDEDLASLTAALGEHVIDQPRSYYRYDASHAPDVWLCARAVWEVRCADLSLSPAHRAARGLVHPDKGVSLRFPRFIRVRDDKGPEQATSAQQIAEMYLAQDQVKNTAKNDKKSNIDDFY